MRIRALEQVLPACAEEALLWYPLLAWQSHIFAVLCKLPAAVPRGFGPLHAGARKERCFSHLYGACAFRSCGQGDREESSPCRLRWSTVLANTCRKHKNIDQITPHPVPTTPLQRKKAQVGVSNQLCTLYALKKRSIPASVLGPLSNLYIDIERI